MRTTSSWRQRSTRWRKRKAAAPRRANGHTASQCRQVEARSHRSTGFGHSVETSRKPTVHLVRRKVLTAAVSGKHPLEAVVEQATQRSALSRRNSRIDERARCICRSRSECVRPPSAQRIRAAGSAAVASQEARVGPTPANLRNRMPPNRCVRGRCRGFAPDASSEPACRGTGPSPTSSCPGLPGQE
jgi:hypothetical protein